MNVALYARYSSDKQKKSSIEDQFRNCETRATREGWTITARYKDEAISGTEDESGRPGYKALLAAAKAKAFDIVLVDDFSRLSRGSRESEQARRRFVHWGVRLIGVNDGIDTATKGHELMSGIKSAVNQHFVSELKDKISRGMIGQALKGYHLGGRVYGYKLVHELHPDQDGNPESVGTKLEIHPEQAAVVRQIFQMYADGLSPLKIADELNRRRVPAPRATGWRGGTLHGCLRRGLGLLRNPLYIGCVRWNRRRREKDPDTGQIASTLRDKSEWVERTVQDLRIIDDALWARVQARRQDVSHRVVALRALHAGARSTGARPKFLLSGLLTCGECGAHFVITGTAHYGCSTHRARGRSHCANTLRVPRALVERLLLDAIQRDLFTQDGQALFIQETTKLLTAHHRGRKPEQQQDDAKQLKAVELELARLATAIATGGTLPALLTAIQEREQRRAQLLQVVQGQTMKVKKVAAFLPDAIVRFKALLDDLANVTQFQVDKARGMLRELVGGRIILYPAADRTERYLLAELTGDYAGLLRLVCGPKLNSTTVDP